MGGGRGSRPRVSRMRELAAAVGRLSPLRPWWVSRGDGPRSSSSPCLSLSLSLALSLPLSLSCCERSCFAAARKWHPRIRPPSRESVVVPPRFVGRPGSQARVPLEARRRPVMRCGLLDRRLLRRWQHGVRRGREGGIVPSQPHKLLKTFLLLAPALAALGLTSPDRAWRCRFHVLMCGTPGDRRRGGRPCSMHAGKRFVGKRGMRHGTWDMRHATCDMGDVGRATWGSLLAMLAMTRHALGSTVLASRLQGCVFVGTGGRPRRRALSQAFFGASVGRCRRRSTQTVGGGGCPRARGTV